MYLHVSSFGSVLIFPDAILVGSLVAGRNGYPGIGFGSGCYNGSNPPTTWDHRWAYCKGIGLFDNPSNVPYASPLNQPYYEFESPNHAWPFAGALESTASDGNGPKMFVPRLARNEYGYIVPESYHGADRSWITYLYYNPSQINNNRGDKCEDYNRPYASQSIAVSRLTILEKLANRVSS